MVLVAIVVVAFIYSEHNNNKNEHEAAATPKIKKSDETNNGTKTQGNNPFNQKYKQAELTDTHFRNYIHKMSHQKVIAEDKWGFYEITDERIDWLLQALEHEDVMRRLTDGDIYKSILTKWARTDFSQVDEDHNTIWKLQGGTIGEATGILSEEEEKLYIEYTTEGR